MRTIQITENQVHQGSLMLVNSSYAIRKTFPQELRTLPVICDTESVYLTPLAGTMLSQLISACSAENKIIPISGYRSMEEQTDLFRHSLAENGEAFTLKYVARPGCSEHQTGLAIDVAEQNETIDFICPEFPYNGICQEFRRKAPDFGFIERYQKGEEQITGISHEPWHFRYVGRPHAKIMDREKLALEEYVQMLRSHRHGQNPLPYHDNIGAVEVSFLEVPEGESTAAELSDKPFQLSGNNVDGVIITVWR